MNERLDYNNIVRALSSRDKCSLVGRDDAIQVRSDLGNNHFSDDLVDRVTKVYRYIIS